MGDHTRREDPVEPETEPYAYVDTSKTVERKVTVSTIVAGALGGVLAVLNAVAANPGLISGLPKAWQSVILVVTPLILVFAAGWVTPSSRT